MWRMVPFEGARAKPYLCRACAVRRVLHARTIGDGAPSGVIVRPERRLERCGRRPLD